MYTNKTKFNGIILCILSSLITLSCKNNNVTLKNIKIDSPYQFSHEIEAKKISKTVDMPINFEGLKEQVAAYEYAMIGNHKKALYNWSLANRPTEKDISKTDIENILTSHSLRSAKEYITKTSLNQKLIIINEAHHDASHRVFTTSILKTLYNQGFTHLGLEALDNISNADSLNNHTNFPLRNSGYYMSNPQFGNLIREALDVGFHIFSYEADEDHIADPTLRELNQAENILKVMGDEPNGKFIIHCGFDHNMESNYSINTMASILSKKSGINPLTINQHYYGEHLHTDHNQKLSSHLEINTPSVLIDTLNQPFPYIIKENEWQDIAVFHPNTNYINNRPDWIFTNGFKKVNIDISPFNLEFPVFVMAFKETDSIHLSTPVDMYEIEDSSLSSVCLALKQGKYNIVLMNKNREALYYEKYVP